MNKGMKLSFEEMTDEQREGFGKYICANLWNSLPPDINVFAIVLVGENMSLCLSNMKGQDGTAEILRAAADRIDEGDDENPYNWKTK